MYLHRFAPGEHDETVCQHILAGHVISEPVEHVDHPDGSVEVTFPVPAETVQTALLSYSREDYIKPAVAMTADDIAVLKAVAAREKATTEGKVA